MLHRALNAVAHDAVVRALFLFASFALAACTPGAPPASGGGAAAATLIDVSLTGSSVVATAYGTSGGFQPAVTDVSVGTMVQFINRDAPGFTHTTTSLGSAAAFPASSPFTAAALSVSGTKLSAGFSSGALAPGASSQPLVADVAGTYLYGCFFHYGSPMRAAIVVH